MQDFLIDQSENKRTLTLPNGNKVHFERHDPYGLWTMHYDKGPMPDHLTGDYTSFLKARDAFLNYFENNKKLEKSEKDAPQSSGRNREQLSARPHN